MFNHFLDIPDNYIVLDTETTGLPDDLGPPGIVTLGLTKVQDHKISESVEFRFKPYRKITKEAKRVHGILNQEASKFPHISENWATIKHFLDSQFVVIHNASFDWPIIEFHIEYYNLPPLVGVTVFCSQKSAISFATEENIPMSSRGPSLDDLTDFLKINSLRKEGIHGAKIDTQQTALVVEGLRKLARLR